MIKQSEALLMIGSQTLEEFETDFYEHKKYDIFYSTKNIRKECCDKCNTSTCDNCFLHAVLMQVYKNNPYA